MTGKDNLDTVNISIRPLHDNIRNDAEWLKVEPLILVPDSQQSLSRQPSIGRYRSLTRPERPSLANPKKDLLAIEPAEAQGPWSIFYRAVTCCIPDFCLETCGNMHEIEKKRAWREKVALCFICGLLMMALGFLTFGLQASICELEKNSFVIDQVKQFNMHSWRCVSNE
jgi:hypothetical protein